MSPIVKNILAVIVGIVIGGMFNMGLIMISGSIIPPPGGVDPSNMESLKANIHLFEAKHFIFPFIAHALGTLVGAFLTTKIAATNHLKMALIIGFWFLLCGIMAANMLPAPMWFNALDLIVAYIPMAFLGYKLARK
ncbi:hypothetical protein [Pseudofulvibacter geojedonensis]|uniref:Uncharacterized protein n=1 Tax=Pseudofulvibacter geojedonensis TaxID=1123758 RepID=A0ABW3HYR7_9FLAO